MSAERHSKLILPQLSQGQPSVHDTAAGLDASMVIARRDFLEMGHLAQVERLHGAATDARTVHRGAE